MKNIGLLAFVLMVFANPIIALGQEKQRIEETVHIEVEEISLMGWQFTLIQDAVSELKQREISVSKYRVSLFRIGKNYSVAFRDPEVRLDQRGSSPNMIHFIVEFNADFEILRTYFER